MRFKPNNCIRSFHRHKSNWWTLSVEIVEGTPERLIQLLTKAWGTVSALISVIGMASDHHVNWSIQVSRCVNPLEGGSGPTMSMCSMSNCASGVAKVDNGVTVCRWILKYWHLMHVLAHCQTSLLIPGQTYLVVIRLCVARMLGCKIEWRWLKTLCWNWTGTTGLRVPLHVSQVSQVPETGREVPLRSKEFEVDRSLDSSGSSRWAIANCSKSITGEEFWETACTHNRASAAWLLLPWMWHMSDVNWDM